MISPHRVTAIHVRKACDLSTPAILLAADHEVPILFFNSSGKVRARIWRPTFGSLPEVRRQQLAFSSTPEALEWVCMRLHEKAVDQRKLLKWLARKVPAKASELKLAIQEMKKWDMQLKEGIATKEGIRSVEAQSSKLYWEAWFSALGAHGDADKRTRQPATDPLNALINYGYGMLYGEVESAVITAGLDPMIAFLHRESYKRPAFVFDAIEPFRPWVDKLVARLALEGEMEAGWFDIGDKKVWLSKKGKRTFIPAWYKMMHKTSMVKNRRMKRKDQIVRMMTELASDLTMKEEDK